jgi:hypothetical protein
MTAGAVIYSIADGSKERKESDRMAKYDVKFSCGHTETIQLVGKIKERERRIEWLENHGLCSECYEAEKKRQFEEQNKKAAEEAKEYGLPELSGTEKQVAWGNTIRQEWIREAEIQIKYAKEFLEDARESKPEAIQEYQEKLDIVTEAVEWILKNRTDAKQWIDTRHYSVSRAIKEVTEKIEREKQERLIPEEVKEQAIEDMTIRPSEPITNLVAEIRIQENTVVAQYPEKNEEFRLLVRGLNFTWQNGRWERKTGIKSGSPLDRAAELGVKLLAKGFPVRVYDDTLQAKILTSEYEPECTRWIMKNADSGKFLISWDRSDDFYSESKKLPGARWKSGVGMLVPKEAFREVMDFADRYQFRLSPGAQEMVKEARAEFEVAMVADVKVPQKEQMPQPGRPKLSADQVDGEIDESLRDED